MDDLLLMETKEIWFKTKIYTKFIDINYKNKKIGEIEYDENSTITGKKKFEIVSIYINKEYRKLKLGKQSIYKIFEIFNINDICLQSAQTALKFWKSFNPEEYTKNIFIITL